MAAFPGKYARDDIANISRQWASMESQQGWVFYFWQSKEGIVEALKCKFFGCHYTPNGEQHAGYPILETSINGVSTICGHARWMLQGLFNDICPRLMYWPPFNPKILATTLLLSLKHEPQQSVNNFWSCILHNPTAVQWHLPIFHVLAAFQLKNASQDIATIS